MKINAPPERSTGRLTDIKSFLLHKPEIPTLIEFASKTDREDYSQRIMQRIGIDVTRYAVLNIHKIGVEVPVRYVFEELLNWDGDSTCWPNHIATVDRIDGQLENIKIYLFGWKRYPFGFQNSFFGLKFIPLFSLNALKFQHLPGLSDDNARFLLYGSSGGYPIGIFTMYARSPIAEQGEVEQTQLFLAVGFNFYGNEKGSKIRFINKAWEKVHNRVTGNTLNRFKQLCEWRFHRLQEGQYHNSF
ncbi:MAG: hypothetical protein JXB23_14570 [Candidatus Aminicenantes bacterium]|nr:hypothetical protein [Candidatus Aminicenantes bacterium]